MKQAAQKKRFRQAAETENGMPVSAGARLAHVQQAIDLGRTFTVDLSGIPEDKRPGVVAEIKELVQRASTQTPQTNLEPSSKPFE
jgi:hypothetical protein